MLFKLPFRLLLICVSLLLLSCSDEAEEQDLVDLHITASEDVISIEIPLALNETVLSINSEFNFTVQGLKSNGVDMVTLTDHVEWSLTSGAASSIDQHGLFLASGSAEDITLTAKFGLLVTTVAIRVSEARFDKVVQLNDEAFSLNICQSQILNPIGRYVDDNGTEEIRVVDSVTMQNIVWLVNETDGSKSNKAYIELNVENQAILRSLAAGDLVIQAKALSQVSNSELTESFDQTVDNAMNSIKLCLNDDVDLAACTLSEATVQQGETIALKSVANYQASDGTNYNENVTHNSQWGVDNIENASIAFSSSRQRLDVSGVTGNTSANLSVACGEIQQSLDNVDITKGVTLDEAVSCASNCIGSVAKINVTALDVVSFEVTVNETDVTNNVSLLLDSQPEEITLEVQVNLSSGELETITEDINLTYVILAVEGQQDIIEEKTGSANVFTVLGAGIAKVLLTYRGETFTVVIEVP